MEFRTCSWRQVARAWVGVEPSAFHARTVPPLSRGCWADVTTAISCLFRGKTTEAWNQVTEDPGAQPGLLTPRPRSFICYSQSEPPFSGCFCELSGRQEGSDQRIQGIWLDSVLVDLNHRYVFSSGIRILKDRQQ